MVTGPPWIGGDHDTTRPGYDSGGYRLTAQEKAQALASAKALRERLTAPAVPDNAGLREALLTTLLEARNGERRLWSTDELQDIATDLLPMVAELVAERGKAVGQVAAVRALADELASHRGGHDSDIAADIRRALGDAT